MSADADAIGPIGQIAIAVKDVAASTSFYRDRVGLPFLFEYPGLAFFNCGGVRLMLSRPESPEEDHRASTLYFKVRDITRARDALRARGVPFVDEPHLIARMPDHDLWMTFFRDPDENLLGLMAEMPKA